MALWQAHGLQRFECWGALASIGSARVAAANLLPCRAGAIVAGPRIGRFAADGKPVDMPGHNTIFYMMGVLLLWVRQMCSLSGTQ